LLRWVVGVNKKPTPAGSIFDLVAKTKTNFFTLLVVGSYAKDKQTEKSDLDIILIVPTDAKKISSRLRHFCKMNIPSINLYVFTDEVFKQMSLDKKHNYGKEAVKDSLKNAKFFVSNIMKVIKESKE
jgi:hypothetical protein